MRFAELHWSGYTLKSVNVDCQRCINLHPETSSAPAKSAKSPAWSVRLGSQRLATMAASVFVGWDRDKRHPLRGLQGEVLQGLIGGRD
ncbi:MAG: hypothetical protein IPJ84_19170 [Bdellovibrionales bacterium]|nr:hypothetical protein [Bdellovibrionales bacterium]